jgi:dolichol-phosphate mannosyltransferase
LLIVSFVLAVQTLVRFFMGAAVEGFTTVIMLLLVIGGAIMISLGIIGHYIARIYDEVKNRPRYIVAHRTEEE